MNHHDHDPCTEAGEHRRTQRHSKSECPVSTATEQATGIRFVAEYRLFGDVEGRQWMHETLWEARYAGRIADFEVTGSHPGPFGIQLVTFTVDVPLAEGTQFEPSLGYEEAKDRATTLLCEIVGDSDVDVRWASPITSPDEDEPKIENPCSQCGEAEADEWGMCASCQHNALRSGWIPGKS